MNEDNAGSQIIGLALFASSRNPVRDGIAATRNGYVFLVSLSDQRKPGLRTLGHFPGVSGVAAFRENDRSDVIVAGAGGELVRLRIDEDDVHRSPIGWFGSVRDIAGISRPGSSEVKVLLLVLDNGAVTELRLEAHRIVGVRDLGAFGATRVAAFGGRNGECYGLVATHDGSVLEMRFDNGTNSSLLTKLDGIHDVTGFESVDGVRHAVVATFNGGVLEITSNPSLGRREAVLRSPSAPIRVASAFDPKSLQGRLILSSASGGLHSLTWTDPTSVESTFLQQVDPTQPWLEDVSPKQPDDASAVDESAAGSILAVAGTSHRFYATSWNAGTWCSSDGDGWYQIQDSPPFGYCIAVDPADDSHVVVGERPGDVATITPGATGLWETTDAGYSWKQVGLSPATGCNVVAITFLFFSQASTMYIGTGCGIGRRRLGEFAVSFVTPGQLKRKPGNTSPIPPLGPITAFSESMTATGAFRIWARTATELLFSEDDGASWTVIDVPVLVGGYDTTGTDNRGGDLFSLAAFGDSAYTFFKPGPNTAPGILNQIGNTSTLLFYDDRAQNPFSVQLLPTGDGTGAGGKRIAKSFLFGTRSLVFFSAAQDIYQGTVQPDASVTWNKPPLGASPVANGADFHSEVWDFHVAADGRSWVATDGGIFRKDPTASSWIAQNDFLHTHHIQTVTALPAGLGGSNLAYATHDNGPWARASAGTTWKSWLAQDISFSCGDEAVPSLAMLVRHRELATVTTFGGPTPPGSVIADQDVFPLNFYKRNSDNSVKPNSFGGTSGEPPITLQVIQTLTAESPKPLLDVVMLADLPLTRFDGQKNVPFHPDQVLGQPSPSGNPVLIRSQRWCASARATDGFDQAVWQLEDGNVPAGTFGFWVAGGHAAPVYYACANSNSPVLYRRAGTGTPWTPVATFIGKLLPGGQYGPVFPNPYNPQHLYVLTDKGVQFSTDGASTFQADPVLTALITGAGRFQLTDVFTGGNFNQVLGAGGFFSISTGCLGHMAFLRNNPAEAVAISPFTGVFYNQGDSSGANWRDLSVLLPRPLPRASSVAITADCIYVGTSNRGLLGIANYRAGYTRPSVKLRMLGVDECGVGPTQGSTAVFAADAQGLTAPLSYKWSVDVGTPAANQPPYPAEFAVQLPSSSAKVSVHVIVTDGDGRKAGADAQYSAPTDWMALLIDLVCHVRKLPLNPWDVHPLTDPVPDREVLKAILRDVAETRAISHGISNLSEQALGELEKLVRQTRQ